MGAVEEPALIRRPWALIAALPSLAAMAVCVVFPLGTMFVTAMSVGSPGGFARGGPDLALLMARSVVLAAASAALATSTGVVCSIAAFQEPRFRRLYRRWVWTLLFVNPVFMTFGFMVVLRGLGPVLATVIATSYIIFPLCAVPLDARISQYPAEQYAMARSLGDSYTGFVVRQLAPYVMAHVIGVFAVAAVYAVGFYLVPTYVGLGRIAVVGVAIDRAQNVTGDSTAAAQLGVLAIAGSSCILAAGVLFSRRLQRAS